MKLLSIRRPSMNTVVAISTVLVIFGGIGLARGLGWWKTTGGGGAPAVLRQGNFVGMYDPADIRGSTSFGNIETYFRIPAALIAEAFGIQAADPRVVTAKFADTVYGEVPGLNGGILDIGTDAVKLFVARMTGLPFVPEEATGLPESAIDMILTLGAGMSDEQRQELISKAAASRTMAFDAALAEDHTLAEPAIGTGTGTGIGNAGGTGSTMGGAGGVAVSGTGFVFQGKTSFADVMAAGLTQAQIESVLGMPMGPKIQSVKDFCLSKGLAFSAVRAGLSQLMSL
ncbi:MAG: hypothetical protein RBT68_08000 [Spirochaetia bacterium]|nr:hypothetical protein [Spirochaetia bacterium]